MDQRSPKGGGDHSEPIEALAPTEPSGLQHSPSPEEEEIEAKRGELALLQAQLAERELYLADLRAELTAFEGRCLRQVGVLYAEIDEWNAKITELVAERERTEETRSAANQARTRAEGSYSAAHGVVAESQEFAPSPELKNLYRQVAKRVHPDLAAYDADRRQRERMMKEANFAYERGDADALRRILEEYESSPDAVRGAGLGADLIRVIRQIKRIRNRLARIESAITAMRDSDVGKLKETVEQASSEGRDLLARMTADVKGRINVARRRYEIEIVQTGPKP